MATGAEVVRKYEKASNRGRVEIICKHYHNFMGIVESCTDGLGYKINEEHEYLRNKSRGVLGVRIQTSSISDTTSNLGISRSMIRDAIVANDFSHGILDGLELAYEYARVSDILHEMRKDYDLFNSQLKQLDDNDYRLLEAILLKKRDYYDIANEYNIEYHSALQKIRLIKQVVKNSFLEIKTNDMGFFVGKEVN